MIPAAYVISVYHQKISLYRTKIKPLGPQALSSSGYEQKKNNNNKNSEERRRELKKEKKKRRCFGGDSLTYFITIVNNVS